MRPGLPRVLQDPTSSRTSSRPYLCLPRHPSRVPEPGPTGPEPRVVPAPERRRVEDWDPDKVRTGRGSGHERLIATDVGVDESPWTASVTHKDGRPVPRPRAVGVDGLGLDDTVRRVYVGFHAGLVQVALHEDDAPDPGPWTAALDGVGPTLLSLHTTPSGSVRRLDVTQPEPPVHGFRLKRWDRGSRAWSSLDGRGPAHRVSVDRGTTGVV